MIEPGRASAPARRASLEGTLPPLSTHNVPIWATDSDRPNQNPYCRRIGAVEQMVGLRRMRRVCHPPAASVLLRTV
jgi:hypothetical protein